ncbi:MAG: EF-hand domain-containing protein [Rhodospirillales bacterium]|nr:MAG: EF-hand domain-containing protein [Rhodospirillales bacterium]
MFDFIKNVSATSGRGANDLFAACSSHEDIADSFAKELSKAIAESQDVKPYIVSPDACQGVFSKIDTSQDGFLSHDEAIQALMPVVEDQDIAERIYGVLDPDGNGQVSREQFDQCLDTVIKVTSFEAHLSMTEVTQVSGSLAQEGDFEGLVDDMRSQDGISGQPISTGGFSVDAFWMKLMQELDKNRGAKASPATPSEGGTQATATGSSMAAQTVTYAEASISVETVSANLGAVFSTMA